MEGKCFIGTSGWYYEHWYGRFYPQELSREKLLTFFTKYFNTVELNSTFYHLPKEKTVENWYSKVGPQFLFAVKASRVITHYQKLVDVSNSLKLFLTRAKLLKEKLGPILYQLPPSLKKDYKLLKKFLNNIPKKLRQVVEFRDKSWIDKKVFSILHDFNIAYCIISMPKFPVVPEVTADFTYIRMHGSSALYDSCYQKDELKKWALQVREFLNSGRDTYVYFNNDAQGYAVANAQSLKKLLNIGV